MFERFPALRSRDFRMIWGGDLLFVTIAAQLHLFAINWHIIQLLESQTYTLDWFGETVVLQGESLQALGLGLIGLARVIPIVIFALIGGVVADSLDRRKVLIAARAVMVLMGMMMGVMTLTNTISVGALYLLTAAGSAANAFANPARQALIPSLVPREHLTNALSLNTLLFQWATIGGPALFALLWPLIQNVGLIYLLDMLLFTVGIAALLMLRYRAPIVTESPGLGMKAVAEGLRFTLGSPIIWSTMLLDFFATFFSSAQTMLPLVVTRVLNLDASWYGILGTAQPIGAIIAGTIMSMRHEVYQQGKVLLASVAVYGLATAAFGWTTNIIVAYMAYAFTGAGDTISTVIRNVIRQVNTPDHLRGRMTSVNMIFFMGGPQLGEFEAGVVAAAFGIPFSIISGGIATVLLTGLVALAYPQLRNYTADQSPLNAKNEASTTT